MQLCQTHPVGVLDDQGVHVRDVDAGLDDGGADQNLNLAVHHPRHDAGNLLLGHLPMGDVYHHRVIIQHRPNLAGYLLDGLHPVVQIVHLPTTANFPPDGVHQHRPVMLQHVGLYWLPVLGRLVDDGHIPQAGQSHVQGSWDGGGGEGEHIHLLGQLLQPLLVGDPEPLFLVDDQQP